MKLRTIQSIVGATVGILVFVILLSHDGSAQRARSFKLVRSKPSVYMTFVKAGKGADKDDRVWLKIRNNQRWGIRLDMGGAAQGEGDARLFYDVLDTYEHVSDSVSCHVCSVNILGSGKSLTFSIPKSISLTQFALDLHSIGKMIWTRTNHSITATFFRATFLRR